MTTKTKTKLHNYALTLEWPNTSYVVVAVQAPDVETAVKLAYENVDYDRQDTYDDSGETYVAHIARFKTLNEAEGAWAHDDSGLEVVDVPMAHREDSEQCRLAAKVMFAALAKFRAWSDEDGDDDQLDAAMGDCREALAQAEAAGIKV